MIACGVIGDKYESKNKMTKALIGMFGSVAAIIGLGMSCLTDNFTIAMAGMLFKFLLSEGFIAPTITMM